MFKIRLTGQAFSRVLGYERRIKKCLFCTNKFQVKETALVRPNRATKRRVSESKRMNPAISAGRVRKTRKGSAYGRAAESETWNSPSLAWRYSQTARIIWNAKSQGCLPPTRWRRPDRSVLEKIRPLSKQELWKDPVFRTNKKR